MARTSKTASPPPPVEKKRARKSPRKAAPRVVDTTFEDVIEPPEASSPPTSNGVHVNGVTNGSPALPATPVMTTPATSNGHLNGAGNGHVAPVHSPENISEVASAVLLASLKGGPAQAHALGKTLPPAAAGDVVMWCLPEAWRDAAALSYLGRINEDDAALILAWLTSQWWEGYNVGHLHGATGEDLRKG